MNIARTSSSLNRTYLVRSSSRSDSKAANSLNRRVIVTRARQLAPLRRQRGIAMVFLAVGLAALLLMAGLALDVGHATLNKTRLRNATDAAALAAAKMLDSTRNTILASTAALTAYGNNANASGDHELAAAYANGAGSVRVAVQYSAT